MSESTKVDLCRKYFIIGLFCLPLVWLTNFIWFFGEAFRRPVTSTNLGSSCSSPIDVKVWYGLTISPSYSLSVEFDCCEFLQLSFINSRRGA
ncbi:hypothetical protein RB195_006534 [Necator americanus]|uniref:Gamma-secretase subunit PEN-2 n=1 Tax=Necator americanus TaxID=51031 RepID=A0ABR1BWR4_NECAM